MDPLVSIVIVNWNRREDLQECLNSIRDQSYVNFETLVVDNHSTDGSIEMVRKNYPEVKLIVMPDSSYGACETFNIGFANCRGEYIGILDNDVTLPNDWIEKIIERFTSEPDSIAIISTKVIEPKMPADYLNSKELNTEKYIDTFVGCGSIARSEAIREGGYYDKDLFIHANERDLALTLLKNGYRILHYPLVITYHKKPFGIHLGNRSLYFHVRNYIWVILKHYSIKNILYIGIFGLKSMFYPANVNKNTDDLIVGTIGLKSSIFQNKGGFKTLIIALFDAMMGIPDCLKKRKITSSNDLIIPYLKKR